MPGRILLLFFIFFSISVSGNYYWVFFNQKGETRVPALSQHAIALRETKNIPTDFKDFPVNGSFLESLKEAGFKVLGHSRWLNAALVEGAPSEFNRLTDFSFVKDYQEVIIPRKRKKPKDNTQSIEGYFYNYGGAKNQIYQVNGQFLHFEGFAGEGMNIAVLDAGFTGVNRSGFSQIFEEGRFVASRDFVDGDTNVFHGSSHGTYVLSIMALNAENAYTGTAPKANYLLARTEDAGSESPIEELNWIQAAEWADSIGVDVINTSLGYSVFDDVGENYTYADLDGKTTIISRGAQIAARKGILLVTSAGNEGASSWKHITAPADVDSTLTVGAVDEFGQYAAFSSVGPTADGRIKPNITAQGVGVAVVTPSGEIINGNGTSFSAPIIAGLTTCLWQAYPEFNAFQIIDAIEQSAHQYENPDHLKGHGIPDFNLAYKLLELKKENAAELQVWLTLDAIQIVFNQENAIYQKVELLDLSGKIILSRPLKAGNTKYSVPLPSGLKSGIYIQRLIGNSKTYHQRSIYR